ncbi:hypothetical protein HWQ46_03085 [Shewanella sp. D64]|uniref:hypothetical protein n=1 Tax=unclassified Shewanella TaxID=196818 RepID=UPI0022BA2F41|nr:MULTISPECIES: hypothetical protein [unclassified Shewanella]MEC4724531.1 hypothetical protein [Shewanella sp. D64]MEC4736692.1 hypothetical protein [Shewanella sp. E94]WBJ94638.1 hypothetical protein HWQ47_22725 [Shewanella sp. MTB7]
MARAKLNKGERDGIRLIADLFVIEDLKKNVLAKSVALAPHLPELEITLLNAVPKVYAAQSELQKQIKEVRKYWLSEFERLDVENKAND